MVRTAANTPRARALGAALREARTGAGMTTRQLGERVGRDHTLISRWEHGKNVPSVDDTEKVLQLLNVPGVERERVVTLARDAADQNWVAPGLGRKFAALTEWERLADTIVNVQPSLIPGLLQTAAYTRSLIMSVPGATRGEADAGVMYRLARQEVLTRNKPVNYIAIIGEDAIKYPLCDRETGIDQLRHLLKLIEQQKNNLTIQALPMTKRHTPAHQGPFEYIRSSDLSLPPIVYLEHYRSSATLTDAKDVRDYGLAVDQLRQDAMSPDTTTRLIAQTMDKMENTT
jgi:transcriptional regulator with XRE-family HTH domain